MAGQSITFDFLTRGADSTAGGFRKVADNTVLAARGAKVLSNAIETLGQKENRTAAESALLAKALRQTGDAEDRVAARAVVADAAIRRLDDAMQDSTKHSGELRKSLGGLKLNPGLLGPALLLAPAMTTLAGAAAGAAAGLGGAFAAGGIALAAFGAVAKPILTDAKKAATAVEAAQVKYNLAIAAGVSPAKAYKAEQLALGKAYAGLSPAQIALSKQLGTMADAWSAVKAAETPVVAGALQPWLKSVTGLTSALGPIIAKVAPVIDMSKAGYQAIKTVQPDAKILYPGLAAALSYKATVFWFFTVFENKAPEAFLDESLKAGMGPWFDVASYHPYSTGGPDGFQPEPPTVNPADQVMLAKTAKIRASLDNNGMASKPLWLTEWGFDMAAMSNDEAARRFQVQLPLMEKHARSYLYTWRDNGSFVYGLVDAHNAPRQPFYDTVHTALNGGA